MLSAKEQWSLSLALCGFSVPFPVMTKKSIADICQGKHCRKFSLSIWSSYHSEQTGKKNEEYFFKLDLLYSVFNFYFFFFFLRQKYVIMLSSVSTFCNKTVDLKLSISSVLIKRKQYKPIMQIFSSFLSFQQLHIHTELIAEQYFYMPFHFKQFLCFFPSVIQNI